MQCNIEEERGFFLVLPVMAEINSHEYSDILWLFILGKNLAAQVIFFNVQRSFHHAIPHPVLLKKLLQNSKHCTPCAVTTQNTCSQTPSHCRHWGARRPECSSVLHSSRLTGSKCFSPWETHGERTEHSAPYSRPWLLHTVPKSYPRYGH